METNDPKEDALGVGDGEDDPDADGVGYSLANIRELLDPAAWRSPTPPR